jgi:hypothetical protein
VQKSVEDLVPKRAEDGLGMKLDAHDRIDGVRHSHDLTIVRCRGHPK